MIKTVTLAEILLMSLITTSLFCQNFNFISDYDSQGVPLDMVNTSVSQNLLDNISTSFPEGYPVPDYNPDYIADGVETNVIITELADVWVTFVGEGAGYKNVLGFYTYDVLNPPSAPPSDEDITIIFPNVSAAGSGGGLIVGDKMYLGQFPANTGIGWVLIANGWNGNQVTYGNWMLYSNPFFNPEGSPELQKHNVNLYDDNELVVVFGFEDIRRDFGSCDQDFNDALFLVTSNPYNAMETGNFNPISTDGGDQSSGNDGGLESHRGLSSAIANRTFDRSKHKKTALAQPTALRSGSLLSEIVPASIRKGDTRSISSPTDLKSLTKATEVWSADYIHEQKRYATVFATTTEDGVYDHTKVVCDRLAGSEIVDIKEIMIKEQKYLLTSLKTDKGTIEYTISFSIGIHTDETFNVYSKWAVNQYADSGTFLNYQVWSATPFTTIDFVKTILENLETTHTYEVDQDLPSYLPQVYIKSGRYENNEIVLNLMNTTQQPTQCNLVGSISGSELDDELELYLKTITIPAGEHQYIIQNPEQEIFDLEVKIQKDESESYDVAYFSDGAWGLDYDQSLTTISDLSIQSNPERPENSLSIARDLHVEFESADYLSVYKHLRPSGKTVNLEAYNAVSFEGQFTKPIQIRLIKEGIKNWEDQFVYVLQPNEANDLHTIPFSYFRSKQSSLSLAPTDIKLIVFTQVGKVGMDEKLTFKNVHFHTEHEAQLSLKEELNVYPNPTAGPMKISFESPLQESGKLIIFDIMGRRIMEESINIYPGINLIEKDFTFLGKGVFILKIEGNTINRHEQKVVLH